MFNLERKAKEILCLRCGDVYEPSHDVPTAEYPYCLSCNFSYSHKLMKLQEIKISADVFRSKPGKRNGMKTELDKKKKKRIYLVTKGGVHEKTV